MKSIETDRALPAKVLRFFRLQRIPKNAAVLVAASGGPDSTALLFALSDIGKSHPLKIFIGHFDHGLRTQAEALREEAFIQDLGTRLRLPVYMGCADPGIIENHAKSSRRSLEETARDYRYAFLRAAAERISAEFIALGHTRSDSRETQILKFFQGSFPHKLSGIAARRGALLRPLIQIEKSQILSYLQEKNVSACIDPSNGDTRFLRNSLRSELIPSAEHVFPGCASALEKLSYKAFLLQDYLCAQLKKDNPWVEKEGVWSCDFQHFQNLHPYLRLLTLFEVFDKTNRGTEGSRVPFMSFRPLLKEHLQFSSGEVLSGKGFSLELSGERLFWKSDIVLRRKKGYLYVIDADESFCIQGFLKITVQEVSEEFSFEPDVYPCKDGESLIVRSRRQGDVLQTEGGKKSLKKLFSDLKIPEGTRESVPVLQDSRRILAVFAEPFGFKTIRSNMYDTEKYENVKYLRFRMFKIGEGCGQTE